jgi:hypothetical protein
MGDKTQHRTFELDSRAANGDVIPAVLSTEAPVKRSYGNEILRHDSNAINMERFPLPVITVHDQGTIPVGVAENPKVTDGKLRADIRFGASQMARTILEDVKSGIIRSLSVGYHIDNAEERGGDFIATQWTPFEASIVACPADIGAGFFRNLDTQGATRNMEDEIKTTEVVDKPAGSEASVATEIKVETRAADPELVTRSIEQALADERARTKGIREFAMRARVPDAVADDLIERGVPLAAAKSAIIEKWSASMAQETGHVQITRDEKITKRDGIINALSHRMGSEDLNDNGRQYFTESFMDMASAIIPRGIGESRSQYAVRLMSTSDVPNILANVANKSLLKAYEEVPKTFEPFVTRTQVTDFKVNTLVNTSNFPSLVETGEGVDYSEGTFTDKKETFYARSWGRTLQFTRQMMINDDLSALSRLITKAGAAVGRLEGDLVYGILTANAAMADGTALFHANHANLGTGGAISDTTLAEAFKKFRLQTGIGGEVLGLTPRYLVAPAALENTILKQMSAIYAATVATQNVYVSALTPIIESRLDAASATAWYLIGMPNFIDTIYLATISGQAPIITEEQYNFHNGAWEIKVVADRAVAAVDHRNMFKNAGA